MALKKLAKIAASVVSLILAGTVCMAATCNNGGDSSSSSDTSSVIDSTLDASSSDSDTGGSTGGGTTGGTTENEGTSGGTSGDENTGGGSSGSSELKTDDKGNLVYAENTELTLNVGYGLSNDMSISYTSDNISGSVTMPDGVAYSAGSLKPVWQAFSDTLGIKLTDSYTHLSGASQITGNLSTLGNYNIVTATAETIVREAAEDENLFLNLADYLDYMPNYKKYLQDNPAVCMTLLSDTESGAMYYAPYFDGDDDVYRYTIAKKNWVSRVLDENYNGTSDVYDASKTITFADSVSAKSTVLSNSTYGLTGTSASVESFMGTTGSWWVESTDPDDISRTVTIVVNYNDALTAARDCTTELGKAYADAVGATYTEESGNIVDIQNAAIKATAGNITGDQLTKILRAYITIAYQDIDGNSYYDNLADVFNGEDAAWDVDLLVALMRCIVTYGHENLGTDSADVDIYGLTSRRSNSQYESDIYRLAGELYGVRGFESNYNYTYIDSDGAMQDARADEASYDALDRMHTMVQEGLLNVTGEQVTNKTSYYNKESTPEAFMIYDLLNLPTANGGYAKMGITTINTLEDDYDFEPIVTPVSKWNDGDTATAANTDGIRYAYDDDCKYMRFTESYRSVKNTGFCVPYDSVKNDSDKLAAVLTLIDYMFSNDGQIIMSFGEMSSSNNDTDGIIGNYAGTSDNGWWYAAEVTNIPIGNVADLVGNQYYIKAEYASQYFCYKNNLYVGTYYNGKQYPTLTDTNLEFYYGYSVNGVSQSSDSGFLATSVLSFTNYCRRILGASMPIGIKLQVAEYQFTSDQGKNGADIVGYGLINGTISHLYQQIGDDNDKGYWYTNVPTMLPYDSVVLAWIDNNTVTLDSIIFANDSSMYTNFYIDVIWYGLNNSGYTMTYISNTQTVPATAAECVKLLENYYLSTYENYMNEAWQDCLSFYKANGNGIF